MPEEIRVSALGQAPDGVKADGVVREVVYAGSETRIVVDADAGVTLTALVLNSSGASTAFPRDTRVTLSWSPDSTRFLD